MPLTHAIQELCLTLLCFDEEGGRALTNLLPARLYDPFYREIAHQLNDYWVQWKKAPGEHTLDVFDTVKSRSPQKKEIYDEILESIKKSKEGINRAYVLSQVQGFVRRQQIKKTMAEVIQLLQNDSDEGIDQAEAQLLNAFRNPAATFDTGTFFSDKSRSLSFLNDAQRDVFPTGIKEIDQNYSGPARKELLLFMALAKRGKTWACVHLAKHAMLARKRVCHISLEVSEPVLCQRYVQSLFSLNKRQAKTVVSRFDKDELGRFIQITEDTLDRPHLMDPKVVAELGRKIDLYKNRPPLVIKEFPTSELSISGLRAYLECLETFHHFIPDLLIVDYPALMKLDEDNLRISLGHTIRQLRGLAVSRNIAILAPAQSNRTGMNRRQLNEGMMGEDFSMAQTCDGLLIYSQTKAEYERGLARLTVGNSRNERMYTQILISQAYDIGQFCLDSCRMNSSYWDKMNEDIKDEEGSEE
jgi:replicative DNA helicase